MSTRQPGESALPVNIFVTSTVPSDRLLLIPKAAYITPASILHEAAHSYLNLDDLQLAQDWGPKAGLSAAEQEKLEFDIENPDSSQHQTAGLTDLLQRVGCAPPQ